MTINSVSITYDGGWKQLNSCAFSLDVIKFFLMFLIVLTSVVIGCLIDINNTLIEQNKLMQQKTEMLEQYTYRYGK